MELISKANLASYLLNFGKCVHKWSKVRQVQAESLIFLAKMKIKKYDSYLGFLLDIIAYILTAPFGYALDSCMSSYWLTSNHQSQLLNTFKFCIVGPVFGSLALLLLPNFIFGYIIWIVVCYGKQIYKSQKQSLIK